MCCSCSVAQSCPTLCDPRTAAQKASLSLTISWSLPKFMPIASVMPSSHVMLWRPLLHLPSIFPGITDFGTQSCSAKYFFLHSVTTLGVFLIQKVLTSLAQKLLWIFVFLFSFKTFYQLHQESMKTSLSASSICHLTLSSLGLVSVSSLYSISMHDLFHKSMPLLVSAIFI